MNPHGYRCPCPDCRATRAAAQRDRKRHRAQLAWDEDTIDSPTATPHGMRGAA